VENGSFEPLREKREEKWHLVLRRSRQSKEGISLLLPDRPVEAGGGERCRAYVCGVRYGRGAIGGAVFQSQCSLFRGSRHIQVVEERREGGGRCRSLTGVNGNLSGSGGKKRIDRNSVFDSLRSG